MKLKNNILKMKGAWIGAGLGLLAAIIAFNINLPSSYEWVFDVLVPLRQVIIGQMNLNITSTGSDLTTAMVLISTSNAIIGFLIGWAISKYRRKR